MYAKHNIEFWTVAELFLIALSLHGDANVVYSIDCIELHLVTLTFDFLSQVSILTIGINMGILSSFVCSSVRLRHCVETVVICYQIFSTISWRLTAS